VSTPLRIPTVETHVFQVLSRLSGAIAKATALTDMYDAALDALRDGLGLERSSILVFDADGVMRFVAWRGLSDRYRAAVEGHSPWRPDSPDPQPVCVPDVTADPQLEAFGATFATEGIAALAFIPLLARNRVLGKFMCYYGAPHLFSDDEVALAVAIAQQVAFAIERTQTYEALHRNDARLRFALDAAHMGTWEWDLRTNRVVWSDNLPGIHGLPPGAFDGTFQSYEREIHPADKPRVLETATRAISLGVPYEVEYRIVAPDGSIRWVEGKGRVEYGPEGVPARMAGVCMDITRRKHAELERADLAARAAFLADVSTTLARSLDWATTLQSVADLVVPRIADCCAVHMRREDGGIPHVAVAHVDPARLEWIRGNRDAFRVRPDSEYGVALAIRSNRSLLYSEITPALLAETVADVTAREALRQLAVRSAMVVPIRTPGEVLGTISFVSIGDSGRLFTTDDLTLAEEIALRAGVAVENSRLYTATQEANRLKDEFLATLSHELRTPLNAILGWARMLEQGHVVPERLPHAFGIIRRNAEAQTRLIGDILDVARITSNKLHLDLQLVDVSDVIALAVDGFESQAQSQEIAVTLSATPHLIAWADPARLQQMASNLLSNAVKFTPRGGRVSVNVQQVRDRIHVQVVDTGAGIRPEFLPHLFERFRQADASTTRAHGGLGLGLAITRHLAELHGGTVEADSEGIEKGSTFTIDLPIAEAASAAASPAGPSHRAARVDLRGRRVLAVDDQEDSRQLVCELLARTGAEVRSARSVSEALQILNDAPVHLVLADIAMPIDDGFALLERVSNSAHASGVPVIALTAYAREEDRDRALAAGFAAHLAKPVEETALFETIATVLGSTEP